MIISPLRVPKNNREDKWFTLGLNQYRNEHYQTLNNAKKKYKELVYPQIQKLPVYNKIQLTYILYPKTKHLTDLDNICSVHAKMFQDALVECGKLEEDNYLFIPRVVYEFGSVDKENARCEIHIKELGK